MRRKVAARKGSVVLLALALAVVAIGLIYHPGTAEMILPGQLLERHPTFVAEETDRDCDIIEETAETADEVADMFDIDADIGDGKYETACLDQCEHDQNGVRYYCSEGELTCVCRLYAAED